MDASPADAPSRLHRVAGTLALALLLVTLAWVLLHLPRLPEQVALQLHWPGERTLGSRERVLAVPVMMLFMFGLLTLTERAGLMNLPDQGSPQANARAARRASAGLRLLTTLLLSGASLSVLYSSALPGLWPLWAFPLSVAGVAGLLWLLRR